MNYRCVACGEGPFLSLDDLMDHEDDAHLSTLPTAEEDP